MKRNRLCESLGHVAYFCQCELEAIEAKLAMAKEALERIATTKGFKREGEWLLLEVCTFARDALKKLGEE